MKTEAELLADPRMRTAKAIGLAYFVGSMWDEQDADLLANAVYFAVDSCGLDADRETLEATALAWLEDPEHSGER